MEKRTYPENFFWVFFCCGGLPILGIIKGIIIVVPIFIITFIGFTGISILFLPHDIFLTYRAISKTSIIGIKLKILTMLLLPIALISWPFLVAFLSSILGIFYGLFCPTIRTFMPEYHLLYGGFVDVFKDIFNFISDFFEFNSRSYFSYLREIEERKVDEPFDIDIIQIFISLILAACGSIVGVIAGCLMWIIKLIPSIYRLYYILFYGCYNGGVKMLMYSLLYLIAIPLVPVVAVLAILLYIGYGLYEGIYCAIEGYKQNIIHGILTIWDIIYKMDYLSNEFVFGRGFSFFPNYKEKYLKKD
jgi:hypothetical protein